MTRYWILSALLHLGFFYAVTWKHVEVIEDPILSVSLFENNQVKQVRTLPSPPAIPKTSTASTKIQKSNTPNAESAVPVENENSALPSGTEYSTGNVSLKPKVLRTFKVTYPEQAKKDRVEGTVRLSVLIDEEGQVKDVAILEGPGHGLNEAAQEALKNFVFSPAEKDGDKVAVRIVYVYRFRLESR